ncbi:hypothetical protein, partial [Porphyromonas asaccharolytica]
GEETKVGQKTFVSRPTRFSTWASFISSEVSFDSSEEFFIPYLGNKNFPRGDFEISTWRSLFPDMAPYRYVVGSKLL